MKIASLILSLALISCLCGACPSQKSVPESATILTIGTEIVTQAEFQRMLDRAKTEMDPHAPPDIEALKIQVLDLLTERSIFAVEAKRRNLIPSPEEIEKMIAFLKEGYPEKDFEDSLRENGLTHEDWKKSVRYKLMEDKIIQELIHPKIQIPEVEIRRHYQQYQSEFQEPEMLRARHILVSEKSQAEKIFAQLQEGVPFDSLAKKYSTSPEAERGGDLGYFPRGQYPAIFDDICFSLPVGATSRIISSEYGYHIFQILDKKPARVIPFEESRAEIELQLKGEREQELIQEWLKSMKEAVPVVINQQVLRRLS